MPCPSIYDPRWPMVHVMLCHVISSMAQASIWHGNINFHTQSTSTWSILSAHGLILSVLFSLYLYFSLSIQQFISLSVCLILFLSLSVSFSHSVPFSLSVSPTLSPTKLEWQSHLYPPSIRASPECLLVQVDEDEVMSSICLCEQIMRIYYAPAG